MAATTAAATAATAAFARAQVCRLNGGIYVKAAQFASDLASVPPEYRAALGALTDDCAPMSAAEAAAMVEAETGRSVAASFASFSAAPVAAASLAQARAALPTAVRCW